MGDVLMSLLAVVLVAAIVVIFWVVPLWLGLRAARERNRAAAWMWFAVHPLGGWITYAVLQSLPPLKVCPECAEKVKAAARRCPHCQQPLPA